MSETPTSTDTKLTSENTFTGYGVARELNKALKIAGLGEVRPQMVYSYIQNDLLKHVVIGGQKRVTQADASAWISKFVANRKRRQAESA
jgi:hypothetical protein